MEKHLATNSNSIWNEPIPKELFSIGDENTPINEIVEIFSRIIAKSLSEKRNLIIIYPFLYCAYLSIFAIASYYILLDKYNGAYPTKIARTLVLTSREKIHTELFNTIRRHEVICQTFILPGKVLENGSIERIAQFVSPKARRASIQGDDCIVLFSEYAGLPLPDRVKCIIVDVDSTSISNFRNNVLPRIRTFMPNIDSIIFITSSIDKKTIELLKNNFNSLVFGIHPFLIEKVWGSNKEESWVLGNRSKIQVPYLSFGKTYQQKIWVQPCIEKDDEVPDLIIKCWKGYKTLTKISTIPAHTVGKIQEVLNRLQRLVVSPELIVKEEKSMFWYMPRKDYVSLYILMRILDQECSKDNALRTVFLDVQNLYGLLCHDKGKISLFKKTLDKFISAKKEVMVCCFSEPEYRALKKQLSNLYSVGTNISLNSYGIYIENVKNFYDLSKKYDYVILPTFFIGETILNEVILSPLFGSCVVLGYPHEIRPIYEKINQLTDILDEICFNESQRALTSLVKSDAEENIWKFLFDKTSKKSLPIDAFKPRKTDRKERKLQLFSELEESGKLKQKVEQWTSIVSEVQGVISDVLNKPQPIKEITDTAMPLTEENEYVEVVFEEGGTGRYSIGQLVDVLYEDKVEEKAAEDLTNGDKILLIDNNYRKNLLSLILEMLSSTDYDREVEMTEKWWMKLGEHAKKNNHNPEDIQQLLKAHGSDITSPITVRAWLKGYVYGPNNPENIRILGEIYNDYFLKEFWQEIGEAVSKVRGIRIKTGRKIAKHIRLLLKGAFIDQDEIDKDADEFEKLIGLRIRDILDQIRILTIREVKIVA